MDETLKVGDLAPDFSLNKEGVITYLNTFFKADKKEDYEAVFTELGKLG